MNKKIITIACLSSSVGFFVLAINIWICGGQPFCRSSNSLSAQIVNAAITITPHLNQADMSTDWSGPEDAQMLIESSSAESSVFYPPPPPNDDH